MAIFEKKSARPKKPAESKRMEMLRKLHEIAEKRAVEWMNETFSDRPGSYEGRAFSVEAVKAVVDRKLETAFETMIYQAVGIERRFDRTEVRYNSPIKAVVEQLAANDAARTVTELFKTQEKKLPSALPEKVRRALERKYEEAYVERLHEMARELGAQKAESDAEQILSNALLPGDLK